MKLDERNKVIVKLINSMDDWDYEVLLEWAKDRMHDVLDGLTDSQLEEENKKWEDIFGSGKQGSMYDD